ncbi:hypothetical protein [Maribacter aurantiacus]|uniref:Uncharacterized protein n=1 Tax=Maribacter aurantiacus TaxID=1882343 RepID=A0A5R8MBT9_9FLAO|nr:hypothetical protein [Maribacter aurantiacus]TLF47024.1 hypothetical protein FEK29_04455 [Maribacter aurantiacus]
MEYKRDFNDIGFRVIFDSNPHITGLLGFAAQPHEMMLDVELNNLPETFLVRGRVETGERLLVGFRDFAFEMTPDLHLRLGKLYEIVRMEYRNTMLRNV